MPTQIIDNDVDPIFYVFAAQGSLHYGLLMMSEAIVMVEHVMAVEVSMLQSTSPEDAMMIAAKAHALLRHAKDYMRGASQTCKLLLNSDHGDESELTQMRGRAIEAMGEVNGLQSALAVFVEKHYDPSEFAAKSYAQWQGLLSNRSFMKTTNR